MASLASPIPLTQQDQPDARDPAPSLAQAFDEDAYWRRFFWRERYYRADCDYEDYAPAYCVGYVGFAQYGGSFEDAERSLEANWLRIRGDSQLEPAEAALAMRAAWRRMEQAARAAGREGAPQADGSARVVPAGWQRAAAPEAAALR